MSEMDREAFVKSLEAFSTDAAVFDSELERVKGQRLIDSQLETETGAPEIRLTFEDGTMIYFYPFSDTQIEAYLSAPSGVISGRTVILGLSAESMGQLRKKVIESYGQK